ncbi:osmotic avoidance abnormal protein 3 [Orussus abietinus]|uniref:osmotic avoidance abnormal protein 3 n=1 Tax=Orussus abietinus TaxID=222816 RepID=UPI000C71612D|nr:osmotic avoidance abnormal protein 3 [Orussus abietinus]
MSESVKVAVRCRPMAQRELQQECRNVVTIDPSSKSCTLESTSPGTSGKVFQFDAAFGSESTTESLYEDVGSVIVEAVLDGYNGTVFAYGQTGCGKSFTMRGFVERSLEHLFEATSTSSTETRYLALLSYLEIYNEKLRDLLQDSEAEGLLQLKEDATRGTYVAGGLREVTVKNAAECALFVERGDRRRALAATKMNAASSRSHAVLTLSLEAIAINEDDKRGSAVRRGRLHLVDLAGSERQARTGATGDRLKEAASINLSLSALGNVISALAAGNGRHVPYRDSKLTRLLRDSLGGNARTLMIACVSPSDADADETLSTLRYAARARCIKNKPIVNEDPKDALLRQYQLELQRLRKLLEGSDNPRTFLSTTREEDEEIGYREEVEKLKKECEDSNLSAQRLQEELRLLRSRHEAAGSIVPEEEVARVSQELKLHRDQDQDPEKGDKRRRKREAARQEVLKRLERLTIGGEARGDEEAKKRRERRRKRLEVLAGALQAADEDGGAFEVYGQLKSTEEALKRMARRAKQLEVEAADLQASWDAERRDLLRRELLATQICEAMVPHLRPGCPFRDVPAVRAAATWCDELGRWRLPDVTPHIPLPPALGRDVFTSAGPKADHNNNDSARSQDESPGEARKEENLKDIAGTYFRRSRIDALLAHVRAAKTLENTRLSKSGGSDDGMANPGVSSHFNALNLQTTVPLIGDVVLRSSSRLQNNFSINGVNGVNGVNGTGGNDWQEDPRSGHAIPRKNPPRILQALPSYPIGSVVRIPSRIAEKTLSKVISQDDGRLPGRAYHGHHARSPTC